MCRVCVCARSCMCAGDGYLASCKPISEADLASFMADCVASKACQYLHLVCLMLLRTLHLIGEHTSKLAHVVL
jgi:hypothetical protein